ncbi:cobaltochelatase subunit CobN [Candidatus Methanoprimaticola sp. MG2]|uniref:cobaltochelatase subunit CobN n=1 Tax=Candidatus Methanoprimaticola sp. MG2 TaxID=3228838 RepID=UPI0039C63126
MVYVSSGYMDADSFTALCRNLSWINADISAFSANAETLDDDEASFMELADELRAADLLIVRMHGGSAYFRKYDRMIDLVSRVGVPTMISSGSTDEIESRVSRSMFPYSDGEYLQLHDFINIGGERNLTGAVIWACRKFCGLELGVPDADIPRAQGVYRPNASAGFRERVYLDSLDWSKPSVAVMFSQSLWTRGVTGHIDRLVEAIESRGANAVPIFFTSSANESIGSLGIRGTIRKYLMKGRRPRVGAVIMCMGFSQTAMSNEKDLNGCIFEELGVPVLQAPTVYRQVREWEEDPKGLRSSDLSMSVVQTELDGQVLAPPLAFFDSHTGRLSVDTVPDRVAAIADSALAWCRLRMLRRKDVRVAIVLSVQSAGRVGSARGLDTMQSLRAILERMDREGYLIPDVPGTCDWATEVLSRGLSDGYAERCADRIEPGMFHMWCDSVPRSARSAIGAYAASPGTVQDDGQIHIQGIRNGNVFIGFQPRIRQGGHTSVTGDYFAFYRWIEEIFGADAIISLGSGDGPEVLEGKECALSSDCLPDIVLRTAVHIHPHAMDDPAGALKSKRRAHSVAIGYMVPAVTRAGMYGDMAELRVMIQEELMSEVPSPEDTRLRLGKVRALIDRLSMWQELGMDGTEDDVLLRERLPSVFDHLTELEDESVEDGLHVLGSPPDGDRLVETVCEMVRSPNGEMPGITSILPEGAGYREAIAMVSDMLSSGSSSDSRIGRIQERGDDARWGALMGFVRGTVLSSLCECGLEMDHLMGALRGEFVPPGPGGSPYLGNVHLLPSGRNMFGPNPMRLPDEIGWEHGSAMAEEIISRYVEENGKYPDKVVMVMHASDTIITGGSEVACVLRLMGLKPVWGTRGGSITGTSVISLEDLGRPRVDVRIGCSSLFTSTFPEAMRLIENGARKVSLLNEGEESNAYRKRLTRFIAEDIYDSMSDRDMMGRMIGSLSDLGGSDLIVGRASAIERDDDRTDLLLEVVRRSGAGASVYMLSENGNGDLRIRTAEESLISTMRTRVLNPRWIHGLMRHGYSGASMVPVMTSRLLSWGNATRATRPWMYREVLNTYVKDGPVRCWMMYSNPHALLESLEDMMKAAEADLWDPTEYELEVIKEVYLETEGVLEESRQRGIA